MSNITSARFTLGRLRLLWAAWWCRADDREDGENDSLAFSLCDCQPYPARVYRQCRWESLYGDIQGPLPGE